MAKPHANLEDELKMLISQSGPMTMAQYMGNCLSHPKYGYYMNKDPFGVEGDFTTAPEVSQMFGEMLGMWIANTWQAMDSSAAIQLIELGPGRGTLMADILRVLNIVPALKEKLSVHMVEMSETLTQAQQANLKQESELNIKWHKSLNDVPKGTAFIIANEFFDALPAHQFEYNSEGWCERMMGLEGDKLTPCLSAPTSALFMCDEALRNNAKPADILEVSPLSITIMGDISRRIKDHGGAALIIDYGYLKSAYGDSLQALKNHAHCSPFENAGHADITTHVNFEILSKCASELGLDVFGATSQGEFLGQMGIAMRAEKLSANATEKQKDDIKAAIKRLTGSDEMGTLFKVMAVSTGQPKPIGFD